MLKHIGVYQDSNHVVRNVVDDNGQVLFTLYISTKESMQNSTASENKQDSDAFLGAGQIVKVVPFVELNGEDPYQAYQRLFTESKERKRRQTVQKIQESIATQTYDVEGHTALWEASQRILSGPYKASCELIDCWGRLMQSEIQKSPEKRLTRHIFCSTYADMMVYDDNNLLSENVIFETLAVTWKHGVRFARYAGLPVEQIEAVRHAKQDGSVPQKITSQSVPTSNNQNGVDHIME